MLRAPVRSCLSLLNASFTLATRTSYAGSRVMSGCPPACLVSWPLSHSPPSTIVLAAGCLLLATAVLTHQPGDWLRPLWQRDGAQHQRSPTC